MGRTANKLRYLRRQFRAGKLRNARGKKVTQGREVTRMATSTRR
jgi:hypothetical protein